MSRKPVDQMRSLESQEHIWAVIREAGRDNAYFTVDYVFSKTNATRNKVSAYMRRLEHGGYLQAAALLKIGRHKTYRLIKDSREAPRVRKDGAPVEQGQGNDSMWRSMRMLKTFSPQDLVATSLESGTPVKLSTAQSYLTYLHKAGYVVQVQDSLYRLLPGKITGPKPPQIQRIKRVFDPNIGKVVWPLDEEEGGAS